MENAEKASSPAADEEESGAGLGDGVEGKSRPPTVKPIESGVFSGLSAEVPTEQLVDNLQAALSAASRGEVGLGSLQRSLQDASRALTASRHAHQSLTDELRVLYRGLNEVMSEKAAVERYATLLTQERDAALDAAEDARREARRDREFLLREQDRFLQLLLEEHEAELHALRRRVTESEARDQPTSEGALALAGDRSGAGSGATLARVQLTAAARAPRDRALPGSTQRSAVRSQDGLELPGSAMDSVVVPPPAVVDLDSLAAEVDGNSERPPPIQRDGVSESPLRLKSEGVSLTDTLESLPDDFGSTK